MPDAASDDATASPRAEGDEPFDEVRFWDDRHGAARQLSSGGFRVLGETGNHALYEVRIGQLLELTAASHSPAAAMTALDAGCGKGIFARGLALAGLRVTGFDPSANAIDECRRSAGPLEDYSVGTATQFATDRLFDLVYSVDVMFHIMDDEQWRASVRRLCRLVRLGGRIALVDHDRDHPVTWGRYQRTRPPADYFELYHEAGIQPDGLRRCGPAGYPTAFIQGTRIR